MVQLNQIPGAIMALVLAGMIGAAGALALGGMQTALVGNSTGYNATQNALTGILNTTAQFGTIGTVIGVGAILAVVVGAFYIFMGNKGQGGY